MSQRLFEDHDLVPGKIYWDKLDVDPVLTPRSQLHSFEDDLLWVTFPNDLGLSVAWFPQVEPGGEFCVELVGPGEEWNPIEEHWCQSFDQLKRIVRDLVRRARQTEASSPAANPLAPKDNRVDTPDAAQGQSGSLSDST